MQRDLAQSEKLAGIGILAAGVAHEINNPLQAILLKSKVILRNPEDTFEVRQSVRDIMDYSLRTANIVRGLASYARSAKQVEASPVNLHEVIREALEMAHHTRSFVGVSIKR